MAKNPTFNWHTIKDALALFGHPISDASFNLLIQKYPNTTEPLRVLLSETILNQQKLPIALDTICEALAKHSGTTYCLFSTTDTQFGLLDDVLDTQYVASQRLLPLYREGESLVILNDNPYNKNWIDALSKACGKNIIHQFTRPDVLDLALNHWLQFAHNSKDIASLSNTTHFSPGEELLITDTNDKGTPIVQFNNWLWHYALAHQASDIHLEPHRDHAVVRMRIDGELHTIHQLPLALFQGLISRLKVLAHMDVIEVRKPQDGRIKLQHSGNIEELELRLAIIPVAFGEKCVIRIFHANVVHYSLQEMGLSNAESARWDALCNQKNGLIVVCGPTGSGKTSTLYNTLKKLATPGINLCTVEDPIEMIIPSFNQTQVNPSVHLSFLAGLRALLRMDPDIIMVGEIRDSETAHMAVQAALTGHLVFTTLHTNHAHAAITRLKELGVPEYLLQATLRGVLAQRLVRVLCNHCKVANGDYFRAAGCSECRQSGYKGRRGLFELLILDEHKILHTDDVHPMSALQQAGMRLVKEGICDLAEVNRAVGVIHAQT